MHFVARAREFHTAGLTAPAGMHLCLDDPEVASEFLGRIDGRIGTFRRNSLRYGNTVVGEQSFRLIFVKIHGGFFRGVRSSAQIRAYFDRKRLLKQS
jgi:hypothetical protein